MGKVSYCIKIELPSTEFLEKEVDEIKTSIESHLRDSHYHYPFDPNKPIEVKKIVCVSSS